MFASRCLIFVAARAALNFPSSRRGVVALTSSCLPKKKKNATCYAVYAVLWIEFTPGRHKHALSPETQFVAKRGKRLNKSTPVCLCLWRFWSYSAGSDRKYSRVRDDITF